jgi:phosphate transport system substrate-binding protein
MSNLKALVAAIGLSAASMVSMAADITGAGATFPQPLYSKWAEGYKAVSGNALNYQGIGSGGGINQIKAKTVDFGATDDAMKVEELNTTGLLQFPAAIGGIVPVINLEGVKPGELQLKGTVLADIFRGAITKWNDKAIADLNPKVKLPATDITLVYRSDSSGTTAGFTDYLGLVSPAFKTEIGVGKSVNWKSGVGGKGNPGVAATVTKVNGSIGYVEYAYAKQNKLPHVALYNHDGKVVQPDDVTFAAAAKTADWKKAAAENGFALNLNNQKGSDSWPITVVTYVLVYKQPADKSDRVAEVLKFFDWSFKNGQKMAVELDFVPLPDNVTTLVRDSWKANIKNASGQAIFK